MVLTLKAVAGGRTADPSTTLRSGRDDKGRGATHLEICYWDRSKMQIPRQRS
jgi:hypothetical protein